MVGCAKREGRGNRGAWAAPCGGPWGPPSVGAALSSSGPQRPSLWRVGKPVSEGRAAGNGFREKGRGDGAFLGRQGADLGNGWTILSQGELARRDPWRLDHCRREIAQGIGGWGPIGSGGHGSHSVPAQPR